MYLTRHKTTSSDKTDITFPMLECWNPMTKVATIAAQVDQRRVLCRISMETLQKKFRASSVGLAQSTSTRNRSE